MIIYNQSNVTFDYILPDQSTVSGEQDSNIVQTEVLTYSVERIKSSDHTFLNEGETAKQTVQVNNNSQTALTALFFKDIMSAGATYVAGSVLVNGVSRPAYDPEAGFALDDIPSGGSATVEYTILSDSPKTQNSVTNYGSVTYAVDDPSGGPVTYTEPTNEVNIVLISARMTVEKKVDKSYATAGEILHYTTTVTNTGTLNKTNLVFTDQIPAGSAFVAGSVKIDGTPYAAYNPAAGFPLSDLAAGESTVVEFDVRVL